MILKTTKDDGHYHLAYVKPDGSINIMPADGHIHEILPPMSVPGNPEVSMGTVLSEVNGHTHQASELPEVKPLKDDITEEERVSHVKKIYEENRDREAPSREQAAECESFAYEDQWTEGQRAMLKNAMPPRACLQASLIEPLLNDLFGKKRGLVTDIKYSPVENGDNPTADVFNAVIDYESRMNHLSDIENSVFEDEAVPGRGFFHVYIDYSDIQGKIKIERFNWKDVVFGEHNNMDGSDAENLVKTKWVSRKKAEQLWPDKADELHSEAPGDLEDALPSSGNIQYKDYKFDDTSVNDYIDNRNKTIRLLELEEIIHRRVPVIVNTKNGGEVVADGWSSKDLKTIKAYPGMAVLYRKESHVERTVVAAGVLLEHEVIKDEGGLSIIPVYAKKVGENWWGIVKGAMDAQRVYNVCFSKGVEIIQSMAAYGYGYDNQTFASPHEEKNFRKNSSKPGFMVKLGSVDKPPVRFEGSRVPAEVLSILGEAKEMIHATMNIKPDLEAGERTSGLAMMQAEQQKAKGVEFLFSNLANAKIRLGEKLIKLIQKCYKNAPQRVVRILINSAQNEEERQQAQESKAQLTAFVNEIMNRKDINIDVAVTSAPHSPTNVMYNFSMLLEMQRAGMPIPPELLIQNSPMNSELQAKALALIEQQKQMQAAETQQKYDTEIKKTVIAKSGDEGQPPQQAQPIQQ